MASYANYSFSFGLIRQAGGQMVIVVSPHRGAMPLNEWRELASSLRELSQVQKVAVKGSTMRVWSSGAVETRHFCTVVETIFVGHDVRWVPGTTFD